MTVAATSHTPRSSSAVAASLMLALAAGAVAQEGTGTNFLEGIETGTVGESPSISDGQPATEPPDGTGQPPLPVLEAEEAEPVTEPEEPVTPPEVTEEPPPGPRQLLMDLWREDVLGGRTALGFKEWLSEALAPDEGAPNRSPGGQAARTRLVAQEWAERAGPVTLGAAGRVVTVYGEAIPTAHCSPLTVCYIELEPGERLTDTPSWGDTARWQVVAKIQGDDPETVVLEIKPAEDARTTNLVIPTDRRLYTIALVNDPEVHTPILAFRWPDSEARALAEEVARTAARKAAEVEARDAAERAETELREVRLDREGVPTAVGAAPAEILDFRFRLDGQAPFRPVRVFADAERTYIDLHPSYRGPLPAVVPGPGEGNDALNTRVTRDGTRLVADRHISDIWLQSGRKRVRIRKDLR